MVYNESLLAGINIDANISKIMLNKWDIAMQDITTRGITGDTHVDPSIADRYRFDFHGLLTFLDIDPKYHYPYTVVNGYNLINPFNGNILLIKMLDISILTVYYDSFVRSIRSV